MSTPTSIEQYLLQLVNRARQDPTGEVAKLIIGASPLTGANDAITSALNFFGVDPNVLKQLVSGIAGQAPLAWSSALDDAAAGHTALMIQFNQQAHVLPGELDLGSRVNAAGYTNWSSVGENIYAYATDPLYAHAGFFIDWGSGPGGMQSPAGHRQNILSSSFTEVGIHTAGVSTSIPNVGPLVVTQDFGTRFNYKAQIVGVVYSDKNSDSFYAPGEGLGGVNVDAVGNSGTFSTTTWSSGGYELVAPAGQYRVTFSGGGLVSPIIKSINLSSANVEVDGIAGASTAPVTTVQQEVMGLYAALYGRAGEFSGYAFWVNSVGNGVTIDNAATMPVSNAAATALGNGFVVAQSTFFNKTYGGLSDSQFIDAMYVNIGGAKPDPSGNTYWSGLLAKAEASGLTVQAARAGLVGNFVDALVEFNTTNRPAGLTDQQWADALTRQSTINNKIEVSEGYATASSAPNGAILTPHSPDDAAYQAATRALQGVTSDHATVVTALANISSAVQHQDLMLI